MRKTNNIISHKINVPTMENYRGFLLDEDTSDHNVTVLTKKHHIVSVFRNSHTAKTFIDGMSYAIVAMAMKERDISKEIFETVTAININE